MSIINRIKARLIEAWSMKPLFPVAQPVAWPRPRIEESR